MKAISKICLLTAFAELLTISVCQNEAPDIVFVNTTIHTMDSASTTIDGGALAVSNGTITCVGTREDCMLTSDNSTLVVDLNGKTTIPGLIDAHIHPVDAGRAMLGCTLRFRQLTTAALRDTIQRCLDREPNAPENSILTVTEFDREGFTTVNGPAHKSMLDLLNTKRPVMIIASNQHNVWINSRALQLLNITNSTPNPSGGRIGRDANGTTGILEESASGAARALSGDRGISQLDSATAALSQLRAKGITTFLDALAAPHGAWSTLKKQGELTARVFSCFGVFGSLDFPTLIANAVATRSNLSETSLVANNPGQIWNHFKFFADGVLPEVSQSAVLLQPYLVDNGNGTWVPGTNFGIPMANQTELGNIITRVLDVGMGIHLHAVGDAVVRQILDVAKAMNRQFSPTDIGIAHAELVSPEDRQRFGELGIPIIASYQWAQKATYWADKNEKTLGPERMSRVEAHATLGAAGASIVYGSDWPVDPLDPFLALKIGVTRAGDAQNRNSHASFGPQFTGRLDTQPGLSREAALRGMTSTAAKYLNSTSSIGSLEVGKFADIVVLDRNYMDPAVVPDEEIGRNKVLLTMVGGRAVFADNSTTFLPRQWVEESNKLNANPVIAKIQPGNILRREITGRTCASSDMH